MEKLNLQREKYYSLAETTKGFIHPGDVCLVRTTEGNLFLREINDRRDIVDALEVCRVPPSKTEDFVDEILIEQVFSSSVQIPDREKVEKMLAVEVDPKAQLSVHRTSSDTISISLFIPGNDVSEVLALGSTEISKIPRALYLQNNFLALIYFEPGSESLRIKVFRLRYSDSLEYDEVTPTKVEKLQSYKDAHQRLLLDFPWLKMNDLFLDFETETPVLFVSNTLHAMPRVFPDIFIADRCLYPPGSGVHHNLRANKYERFYLAARDYANLLLLYCQIVDIEPKDLPNDAYEKGQIVSSLLRDIRYEMASHLRSRTQLEQQLFGERIQTAHFTRHRFTSVYRSEIRSLGRHSSTSESIALAIDAIGVPEYIPHEQRKSFALSLIVTILAHEFGHQGVDTREKQKGWIYEEVFNHAYNVLLPIYLETGQIIEDMYSSYDFNGKTGKRGGALEVMDIVDELLKQSETDTRFSKEDILASFIATAKTGRLRGRYRFHRRTVRGFATVYRKMTGDKLESRLDGCSDEDYPDRLTEPKTTRLNSPIMTNIEELLFNRLYRL